MRGAITGSVLGIWAVLAALAAMEAIAAASGARVPRESLRLAAVCALVAALAGAPVGAMAPRFRGGASRRLPLVVAAVGLSYVAANLAVALAAAAGALALRGTLVHAASAALVVLYGAGILVAPALLVPLLLAGAALEAFTRPGPSDRDRARALRAVKIGMAVVAALGLVLALRGVR
jgi:hypothetical protein